MIQVRKRIKRWIENPKIVCFLLCPLIWIVVLACWRMRVFETPELLLYDFVLARRQAAHELTNRLAIVAVNEADIKKYGWAINDKILSDLLNNLADGGPDLIGLDLYRDLPEPRSGQLLQSLNETLASHTNIICIYNDDVPPPPGVAALPGRTGFNAVPTDRDGTVRRALLFTGGGTERQNSLSAELAFRYLRTHGVELEVETGTSNTLKLGKQQLQRFAPNDGGYVRDDNDAGFQMLLDFEGCRSVPVYSLDQAVSAHPPIDLRGRIVLVGIQAASVNDYVTTPLKSAEFGVMVHAHVIDQILRIGLDGQIPTRFCPLLLQSVWTLVWCSLGCLIGYSIRCPRRYSLAVVAGLGVLAAIYWTSLKRGVWIPSIPAGIGFIFNLAIVTSYITSYQKRMWRVLMNLYSRHVSRDVAEAMWAQRDAFLDGQRPRALKIPVTVLFTDLKGFTPLSEMMESAQLFEWLNLYLGELTQLVLKHHGVLNKFTGDGIMAIFGVPAPHEKLSEQAADAENAVNCALAMGQRLKELNSRWEVQKMPTVSMRIGIYSGVVVAGSIGSSDRFEYAIIGDVVNSASRLESYDKAVADPDQLSTRCRILIGSPTKELLQRTFNTKEIGLLQVKGKSHKIRVFQLLNEPITTESANNYYEFENTKST